MGQFDSLFQPITINKMTLANRVVSTPHAEVYAENGGMPTERYIKYHVEKVKGGIGMTMCGGSSPVSIDSPHAWWSSVNLATDDVIPHLQNLSGAIHDHGGRIVIQITHMGRRSRFDGGNWPNLLSPSGLREPVHRSIGKVIEVEEIQRIVADYGRAAKRVQDGGLDGVEVSAAHNHMIDQFWSNLSNRRGDEYGGSLENRMRFGMDVFRSIREQVGPDFVVGLRMSGDEFSENGLSHGDLAEIAGIMSETGMVDYISVVGSRGDTHATLAAAIPDMSYPPEPFLHLAAGIKQACKIPVMHAQNIKDPVQAARILDEGYVDMVGMTRAAIADPHFMNKTRDGQVDRIRQCVGANYCINRQYQGIDVLCAQNAATSREGIIPHEIEKGDTSRRVVVVGGGPAGLEAARVCAERGHNVTLFEKQEQLGGQVTLAARAPKRDQMAGIIRWLEMEITRAGVDVRLGAAADTDMIRAENPDIVVVATGGRSFTDQVADWGADDGRIIDGWDVLAGHVAPAENVLIYDAISGYVGATLADYVSAKGSLVELVTQDTHIGIGMGGTSFPPAYTRLYEQDVVKTPDLVLARTYREGNKIIAVLENDYTGAMEERAVDQVIVENGSYPVEDLYYDLKAGSLNRGQADMDAMFNHTRQSGLDDLENARAGGDDQAYLMYRIGDCVHQRDIHAAIYDAVRLCKDF